MSLLWKTAAQHWPVYEVGDTSDWDEQPDPREYHISRYPAEARVPPDKMGLPHRSNIDRLRSNSEGYQEHAWVPTHTLQASQTYVYEPHVRNLASLPAEAFHETQDEDPVSVVKTKDGHHVVMAGHHRAAAAILRGDSHLYCTVEGTEA